MARANDGYSPRPRHSRWHEWVVLSLGVAALVLVLDLSGWLGAPNRLLQDALISLQGRAADRGGVVIVAIDDKSVAALGRWPWRRSFHARLIDNIDKDAPLAIGMDVLFTEPNEDDPGGDAALATALSRSGKVVLPLMMQSRDGAPVVVDPIPALKRGAKALGHVHLAVDSDGMARSVYLREGFAGRMWDHLAVAMRTVGGAPSREHPPAPDGPDAQEDMPPGPPAWLRSDRMIVPFAGPPGHFPRLSYIDVLDGTVPPGTFKGKYVLIGATAAGLGDMYATPVSTRARLMSGVEFSANVLDSLATGRSISPAPQWLGTAINVGAVLLALAAMAFIGPLPALLLTAGLILVLPALAAVGTRFGVQFAPTAGMLGLAAGYALWSWRNLDTATRYLVDEFSRLRERGGTLSARGGEAPSGSFMARRIAALRQAAQELRNLHRLVSDGMEALPDATLVCDKAGTVLLANGAAVRHFRLASGDQLLGKPAVDLMACLLSPVEARPVIDAGTFERPPGATSIAARDGLERDLLVKQSPLYSGDGEHIGWTLSLVDVTEIRQAHQQRDHAMRFLSHDMRAPLSSILTLLTLQRQSPTAMSEQQMYERIERHAKKALGLSDDFMQLVRAQSYHYRVERHDLVDVLLECVDDAWEATRKHRIRIDMVSSPPGAYSLIDREMVGRAIGNLLGNALKFSPAGSSISCAIEPLPDAWAVLVQDRGPGIAQELKAELFQPFVRGRATAHVDGAGLGLAFVKTVAQRHGGKVTLESEAGQGSAFRLVLPRD